MTSFIPRQGQESQSQEPPPIELEMQNMNPLVNQVSKPSIDAVSIDSNSTDGTPSTTTLASSEKPKLQKRGSMVDSFLAAAMLAKSRIPSIPKIDTSSSFNSARNSFATPLGSNTNLEPHMEEAIVSQFRKEREMLKKSPAINNIHLCAVFILTDENTSYYDKISHVFQSVFMVFVQLLVIVGIMVGTGAGTCHSNDDCFR